MVDCSTARISSRPANWSFSSKWVTRMAPKGTLTDLSFSGSSAPRKRIFCPVGFSSSSMGLVLHSKQSVRPSFSTAQRYWA